MIVERTSVLLWQYKNVSFALIEASAIKLYNAYVKKEKLRIF